MAGAKWEDRELNILQKCYPIGGAKLCKEKGINRSYDHIKAKAGKLGLKMQKDEFTDLEVAIIKSNYAKGGASLCIAKGVNKSEDKIRKFANAKLGLKMLNLGHYEEDVWSEYELNILKTYFVSDGCKGCQENGLKRTRAAITTKARELGIGNSNVRGGGTVWTKEEEEIIRTYYQQGGTRLCIQQGLSRSRESIMAKARQLGVKMYSSTYKGGKVSSPYTVEELDILRHYYPLGGAKLCKDKGLNRTISGIKSKANNMGIVYIGKKTQPNEWTDCELAILKEYYPVYGYVGVQSAGVKRSENSIKRKTQELGIHRVVLGNNWTVQEDAILKKYYPIGGYKLCRENGLTKNSDAMRIRVKFWGLVYIK